MLKNSAGFSLPSYFSGIYGLNVRADGQQTCRSSGVKVGHPNLERQAPAILERGLVDVGTIVPIRLAAGFAASFCGDARVFPSPVFQDSLLVSTCSRIG